MLLLTTIQMKGQQKCPVLNNSRFWLHQRDFLYLYVLTISSLFGHNLQAVFLVAMIEQETVESTNTCCSKCTKASDFKYLLVYLSWLHAPFREDMSLKVPHWSEDGSCQCTVVCKMLLRGWNQSTNVDQHQTATPVFGVCVPVICLLVPVPGFILLFSAVTFHICVYFPVEMVFRLQRLCF